MNNTDKSGVPGITLSMIVKNEADRYLKRVLESAREYISGAVIIDDGSTDDTVRLCEDILGSIPHRIVINKNSRFHSEWQLRYQQWTETIATSPDWILFLDADEIFEDSFSSGVKELINSEDCSLYCFRLYDFWDEEHYREDALWQAHRTYRPFLLRYRSDFDYKFSHADQHCGRMPSNVFELRHELSSYRLRHYGWARPEDRIAKYNRYMELDPEGRYGSLPQYNSILDAEPNLVKWA